MRTHSCGKPTGSWSKIWIGYSRILSRLWRSIKSFSSKRNDLSSQKSSTSSWVVSTEKNSRSSNLKGRGSRWRRSSLLDKSTKWSRTKRRSSGGLRSSSNRSLTIVVRNQRDGFKILKTSWIRSRMRTKNTVWRLSVWIDLFLTKVRCWVMCSAKRIHWSANIQRLLISWRMR